LHSHFELWQHFKSVFLSFALGQIELTLVQNGSLGFEKKNLYIYMIYLTAIGLTPGGSSAAHIYTQTVHRKTLKFLEECEPCPVFASYTLAFALQLRKKHGKPYVSVAEQ
jgi:hypothetical protein